MNQTDIKAKTHRTKLKARGIGCPKDKLFEVKKIKGRCFGNCSKKGTEHTVHCRKIDFSRNSPAYTV